MKFKKIINEILCLAMAITMFSSGVVKVQAENINLALNKSVTASSDVSGQYSHLSPDKIVDGDTGTRWSAEASPIQWVVVDLGEVYEMNYFHIIWEAKSRYIIPYIVVLIPIVCLHLGQSPIYHFCRHKGQG